MKPPLLTFSRDSPVECHRNDHDAISKLTLQCCHTALTAPEIAAGCTAYARSSPTSAVDALLTAAVAAPTMSSVGARDVSSDVITDVDLAPM